MGLWRENLYILWGVQFPAMMGMNIVVPLPPFLHQAIGYHGRSSRGHRSAADAIGFPSMILYVVIN